MEHIILFYLFESMDLIQTSRIKKITVSLVSLQLLLLVSIFISPVLGNGLSDNNNSVKENVKSLSETEIFLTMILGLLLFLLRINRLYL
jgi:hypothetical protein